jgi:hypothetical protein
MADAKGKGKEVERKEAVAEGKLNSLPFLAVMQESPQGASCFFVASRRRYFVKSLSCFELQSCVLSENLIVYCHYLR